MRVGFGYDVHALTENRKFILGGIEIPYEKGLLGHSDADVLTHALIDALLGGAAMGDIGFHFPDTDEEYRGISSITLLQKTLILLEKEGYKIENIDVTVVLQKPKLSPFISKIQGNLSSVLHLDISKISIKAKTEENLGFTGKGDGVKAYAVALLENHL